MTTSTGGAGSAAATAGGVSNTMMVCLVCIAQTMVGAVMFSDVFGISSYRCLFWNKLDTEQCPPALGWIMDWLSMNDLHISLLLAALARSIYEHQLSATTTTIIATNEVKLAYIISVLLVINLIGGTLLASPLVNKAFWTVLVGTWTVLLALLMWFTYAEYDEPMNKLMSQKRRRSFSSPIDLLILSKQQSSSRRLLFESDDTSVGTSSSGRPGLQRSLSERSFTATSNTFDANGKIPNIAAIAMGVVLLGHFVQIMDLVNDSLDGSDSTTTSLGYYATSEGGDEHFRSAVTMVIIRKCMIAVILGACLRFFENSSQRMVLVAHTASLLLIEVMLAGSTGDVMTNNDMKRTTGVGTFFMILTSIIGAI
mmetsp:Transcript_20790/g.49367  ORF Transcript_20790/g.49367 Transcript_20790/m.49367 type:complete len:368 (-) Transcript_20790:135-1238(-)|eukprot:CAMPEP_0113453130 /NCGR_PEP_ID=MMETSP0014_2-20120614/7201_1 /TAXON_ID=2857 /ORGANISM="Nitzschia sp." /LENGTH=367 /DNA_ID=CAMNT_0000344519 /DNA_START=113 /DNA_END=1216 /DNA_ORIENTATION=- /assembly_acc=CAM_ASM_000159